jgi:anti-sigma28 factor (negative regulator of flagellin synthesis)
VRWRDGEMDFFTNREREKEIKLRIENGELRMNGER